VIVGLVLSNLLYPLVAVVVAALLCGIVVLRHRRPKSVEANMKAFNAGLRALAPEHNKARASAPRVAQRRVVRQAPAAPPVASAPPERDDDTDAVDEVEAETG